MLPDNFNITVKNDDFVVFKTHKNYIWILYFIQNAFKCTECLDRKHIMDV